MTKMEKCKNFVKKHKWKIIAGGSLAVIGGIAYGISKASVKADKLLEIVDVDSGYNKFDDFMEGVELGVGTVDDAWRESARSMDLILNDIKVADVGKLGEGLMNIDGVNEDTDLSMMLCLLDVNKNETE